VRRKTVPLVTSSQKSATDQFPFASVGDMRTGEYLAKRQPFPCPRYFRTDHTGTLNLREITFNIRFLTRYRFMHISREMLQQTRFGSGRQTGYPFLTSLPAEIKKTAAFRATSKMPHRLRVNPNERNQQTSHQTPFRLSIGITKVNHVQEYTNVSCTPSQFCTPYRLQTPLRRVNKSHSTKLFLAHRFKLIIPIQQATKSHRQLAFSTDKFLACVLFSNSEIESQ